MNKEADAARILPLPAHVQAQVLSSVSIASLRDVVLELVKNALDASARTITVEVDFSKGYCVVKDDGIGIPPEEFIDEGCLAKLHCRYPDAMSKTPC